MALTHDQINSKHSVTYLTVSLFVNNYQNVTSKEKNYLKVADLNFDCATFWALPSFGAVTTFSSHTTFSTHKVSMKGSDIDMCSAMYFLFDHNTKYFRIYLCPHTVVATV